MDHIVNSMEHIEIDTACQWLCQLTDSAFPLSNGVLIELCERYSIPVYIDCSALEGVITSKVGSSYVAQRVVGTELCQVDSPASAYVAFEPHKSCGFEVTGMAVSLSNAEDQAESYVHSWILINQEGRPFLFRPEDIKRLASLLKLDHEGQATHRQTQSEESLPSRSSINDERLKHIRRWFREQQEYDSASLSKPSDGLPGARDACWRWLSKSGLTTRGALFSGAAQKNSEKSKKFISAWNAFLKEMTG